MKPFIITVILIALAGCASAPKSVTPTCIEKMCFRSDTTSRIKNIVWGKGSSNSTIKEIKWVSGELKSGHLVQGHFEFSFVNEPVSSVQ